MAKRFKLRLSFPTLQLCRLAHPSSLPIAPSPYQSSRVFPKALDPPYDPNVPEPPPSTPNNPYVSSKIIPVERHKPHRKSYKSSASADFDHRKIEKKNESKASVCSGDYEESESIVLYSGSFDSSYNFGYSLETITERPINGGGRKEETNNLMDRRSRCWRGCDEKAKRTTTPESGSPAEKANRTTVPESVSPARTFGQMMPVNGKVKESFAVVKRSEDPYEDFKRSMLEMILENHIFDATDLEQLLLCFLSLNSRHHHAAILQAFAEIWEVLFC